MSRGVCAAYEWWATRRRWCADVLRHAVARERSRERNFTFVLTYRNAGVYGAPASLELGTVLRLPASVSSVDE